MNEPSLSFTMHLPTEPSQDFITGYLTLTKSDGTTLSVRASSGQRNWQFIDCWERGKAPIPETATVEGGKHTVDLNWRDPGIHASAMGSRYYHIEPDPMVKDGGTPNEIRSEIGLHYDANYASAPGSAGCIVAQPRTAEEIQAGIPGWNEMKAALDAIYATGIKALPLVVEYVVV